MQTLIEKAAEAMVKMIDSEAGRMKEESETLRRKIAEAIAEFGPYFIESWCPEDSPVFKRFGRTVRLVYVGDFDHYHRGADNEPERIYAAGQKQRSVLYLGADNQLYIYEAYGDGSTRSIGMHRLNLENEEPWRLRQFHELLARFGLL